MATATHPSVPAKPRRLAARIATIVALASLATVASACNDDSTSAKEKTVVGTWDVTSFVGLGTDFIADGMSIAITLTEAGAVTFAVQNDQVGICDPGPNCTDNGAYSADGSTITLDPGTEDEESFAYSLQGDMMVWTGSIDEAAVTISMSRR